MTVYYFARHVDKAIKIGFTDRDPLVRLREVANSTGCELHLVAFEEGDRDTESSRHRQYAHLRISGEWFRHEGELRAFTNGWQLGALSAQLPTNAYLRANSYWAIQQAVSKAFFVNFSGVFNEPLATKVGHEIAVDLGAAAELGPEA